MPGPHDPNSNVDIALLVAQYNGIMALHTADPGDRLLAHECDALRARITAATGAMPRYNEASKHYEIPPSPWKTHQDEEREVGR